MTEQQKFEFKILKMEATRSAILQKKEEDTRR